MRNYEQEIPTELLSPQKYKSLLVDIDGTIISERKGIPSKRVTDTINEAKKSIHVGVATTKTKRGTMRILKHLGLSGPSILNSGATVIDSESGDVLWQKTLSVDDIYSVANIIGQKTPIEIRNVHEFGTLSREYFPSEPIGMYLYSLIPEHANNLIQQLHEIPTIGVHKIISDTEGNIDIDITHATVSKGNAALIVADMLGIKPTEMIGVGDGEQDDSLIQMCGLGVAMGNAVDKLKRGANYVAPSVYDDGVADVIERFVLQN